MSDVILRRVAYFVVVVVAGVLAHQHIVAALAGDGITSFLRRNSEAYVLMVLPIYWEWLAARADPDGRGAEAAVGGVGEVAMQLVWFTALTIMALFLQTGVGGVRHTLPQAVVTLGEAVVAMGFVTLYLGWTRALITPHRHVVNGLPTVPWRLRVIYYAIVVLVAVLATQSWVIGNVPSGLSSWLETNTEAYAAMLLLPAYFDLIAVSRKRWVRVTWYGGLLLTPFAVQAALHFDLPFRSWFAWLETTTESFIAAFVISMYFDVIRGRLVHRAGSNPLEERRRSIE